MTPKQGKAIKICLVIWAVSLVVMVVSTVVQIIHTGWDTFSVSNFVPFIGGLPLFIALGNLKKK